MGIPYYTVTVVLEHPDYADLSSIIFQEKFGENYPALRCWHELAAIYSDGHYSVCLDDLDFDLGRHNELLREQRHETKRGISGLLGE